MNLMGVIACALCFLAGYLFRLYKEADPEERKRNRLLVFLLLAGLFTTAWNALHLS